MSRSCSACTTSLTPPGLRPPAAGCGSQNLDAFYDYCARAMDAFGDLVYTWNTFNDPNTYALNAYYRGVWPPFEKKSHQSNSRGRQHGPGTRARLPATKALFPDVEVGYSLNAVYLEGRGLRAQTTAKLVDWWYYTRCIKLFEPCDYVGLSYFAHIPFAPKPLTAIDDAEKLEALGYAHDDMYSIKVEGLAYNVERAHRDSGKPIWIVSNGVCTGDSAFRQNLLLQYLTAVHGLIRKGIPLKGYNVWSAWDNFEWHLGPSYRFGLLAVDPATLERQNTVAADWYAEVVLNNAIEL